MLRCLWRPGWDPPPDGHALPEGNSDEARAARERVREALIAETPRPLWSGPGDYDDIIGERMRALTVAERIEIELRLIERVESMHEYDYDPLKY